MRRDLRYGLKVALGLCCICGKLDSVTDPLHTDPLHSEHLRLCAKCMGKGAAKAAKLKADRLAKLGSEQA